MICGLFTRETEYEAYSTCSRSENHGGYKYLNVNHAYLIESSHLLKSFLLECSGNYRLGGVHQMAFYELSRAYGMEERRSFHGYPGADQIMKWNRRSPVHDSAYKLKGYLSEEFRRMQPSGAGIVRRMDNHKKKKEIHHQLYSEFDIDTSIAESGRGRRVEILFLRKNKDISNIRKEILHLPSSLNVAVTKLDDSSTIITIPYMVLVTYDHLLQYSRCLFSIGGSIPEGARGDELLMEIRRVRKILSRRASDGVFYKSIERIESFLEDSNIAKAGEWGRKETVEFQMFLRGSFLNEVESHLEFPSLFGTLSHGLGAE